MEMTKKSEGRPTTIVLSRFFDSNVREVAGVCSKCYHEEDDVKIVAVNRTFLRKNLKRTASSLHNRYSTNGDDVSQQTIDHCQNDRLKLPTTTSTNDNYALISDRQIKPRVNYNTTSLCTTSTTGDSPANENRDPESVSAFFKNIPIKHETSYEHDTTPKINLSKLKKSPSTSNLHPKTLKVEKSNSFDEKFPLWSPPRSPHNLIEESLFRDPWSLLVATIFLNKTSCMCARPRIAEFLRDFSSPWEVLEKHPSELEKYFLDLGLFKKRAEQVWRMSHDYVHKNWKNARELYGIGKYGEDAYRMFILGDLNIEPTDRFLRIYRDWAKMKEKEDKIQ